MQQKFVEIEEPEKILEEIVSLVSTKLPKSYRFHRFEEIQVLAPMKKGVIGTENLNLADDAPACSSAEKAHSFARQQISGARAPGEASEVARSFRLQSE